ncbi:MAG: DUF4398 domain-containing protein [Gammaproteobacteria bacterium]|nr:DUF4398 domain-containing protein [Gammaproteobacteria bacterium]
MHSAGLVRWWLVALATLSTALLVACAGAPTQELSEARRAWQVAHNAGAEIIAARQMQRAQDRIDNAERAIDADAYSHARQEALAAKAEALAAHGAVVVLRKRQWSSSGL